jgi:iron(III) transport system substrate-binding protein
MVLRFFCMTGVVFALAGCSGVPAKVPLVVYSPHGKEMLEDFKHQFEAVYPEVDVQWLDMGSQDAYDRVRTEQSNPQADVWWGGPMTVFEKAAQEGLLERFVPSWDQSVTSGQKSAQGYWYGTFLTPEVIMYNTRMLQQSDAPRDWDDLLSSVWRGKIMIRSPLASGTMRTIFSAIIQRENRAAGDSTAGFQWLQRLDANTKTYVSDPTQLYMRIAREEAPLTVWDMPDAELQMNVHSQPFGYVLPSSGTPVLIDGIAIVRGAPHMDLARKFYEFVTSTQSMIHQAVTYYRIPTRRDIPAANLPVWISAHGWKSMTIDWQDLAAHEQQWMLYWDEHVKGSGTAAITSRR